MSQPTDVHTLAGAYALDALTEIERAGFARHVADCPSCALEVAELTETASRLSAPEWQAPPARLRATVLAEVSRTRQVAPGTGRGRGSSSDAVRRWRRLTTAAAAAAVLAIGGLAAVWTVQQGRIDDLQAQTRDQRADQSKLDSVLAAGDARAAAVDVPGGGRLIVAVSPSRPEGVVLMSGLPPPPAGKAYQLWLIDRSSATSIGVLPAGAGSGTTTVTGQTKSGQIGITIEPATTGSKAPTMNPIATLAVPWPA
jgi:anti-sigma-K factor RskA